MIKQDKICELSREMELLEQDKIKANFITDNKKVALAEDIKTIMGNDIKKLLSNPNRHNPKKLSLWQKLKKALGC